MTLEWRDGTAYLIFRDTLSDEPKTITNGFKVIWADSPLPDKNVDAYKTAIDGVYQAGQARFNVQNPSAFVEFADVPKPRVRATTELRWRNGWQKLTRKGWEIA